MQDLAAKVAIITGGGQGIGKGMAKYFLDLGLRVVIADIDTEAGKETAEEYSAQGKIIFVPTDVRNEGSVQNAVQQTLATFGRLDALINNAGIANAQNAPVEELTLTAWNNMLATNLTGCFLFAKHAAPSLRKTRGAIVNIASTRALQSEPHTEAYAATKGGLVALTHALAISLGPDIRVNCISPGWIVVNAWKKSSQRTDPHLKPIDHQQHPVGRVGEPQDIAAMAAFLISDAAEFITGQNFVVDGGMSRKMVYAE
jgi:NAD(P)-dependent dehydrogenase (short-subunit alcohol dehydrogenase family)